MIYSIEEKRFLQHINPKDTEIEYYVLVKNNIRKDYQLEKYAYIERDFIFTYNEKKSHVKSYTMWKIPQDNRIPMDKYDIFSKINSGEIRYIISNSTHAYKAIPIYNFINTFNINKLEPQILGNSYYTDDGYDITVKYLVDNFKYTDSLLGEWYYFYK